MRGPCTNPFSIASRIEKAMLLRVPQSRIVVTPVRSASYMFSTERMSLVSSDSAW